jgi:MerR family transcriptional regulator, light-induced transcriptional regulator
MILRPPILRSEVGTVRGEPVGEGTTRAVDGLGRAARHLDVARVTDLVDASIAAYGVAWTWEQVARPVWTDLRRAGDRGTVLGERLFSQAVSRAFTVSRHSRQRTPAQVLLACADEEHHTLALDASAAALAEIGVGSSVLGARVPPQALAAAAVRLLPAVVIIWSETPDTAGADQLEVLLAGCPQLVVIVAGPGWESTRLPATVRWSTTVAATLRLTQGLLGAGDGTVIHQSGRASKK